MNPPPTDSRRARRTLFVVVIVFLAINAALIYQVFLKPKEAPPAPTQPPGDASNPPPVAQLPPAIMGRVTFKGTPPPEVEVPITDPKCAKLYEGKKLTTHFYAVGNNGGLGDVFVYIKSGLEGGNFIPPKEPVVMRQTGCVYADYIVGAQTGQRIVVKNLDPILHNVHFTPQNRANREWNKAQIAGGPDLEFTVEAPDLGIRLKCDTHPWEFGYIFCVGHPFFAVTDAKGEFQFKQLPPSGRYVIEAIHRKAGRSTKEIELADGNGVRVDFEFPTP